MKTLTVYNSKGGVAKSTLAALLGEYLAGRGRRVVIVDLDRQGSQSEIFDLIGVHGRAEEALHRVLKREISILSALTPIPYARLSGDALANGGALWVVQGGPQSVEAVQEIAANPVRYRVASSINIVRGPLAELAAWEDDHGYGIDYAILDMGPSDQIAALAGLVATDWLLIPTTHDYLSVSRIATVLDEVAVAQQVNPDLAILGIVQVMTKYFFSLLRKSKTMVVGEQFLEQNYEPLLLRDSRGPIDLPYDEAWRETMWAGRSLLVQRCKAQEDALRFLLAVVAKLEDSDG